MSPEEAADESLVARARRGDEDAFAALYRRHRDWVLGVAFRTTRNRDDALDVLQETFAYLFERLADPAFALTTAVRSFLYPVVWHRGLDRRRRRRPEVDVDELADVLAATPETPRAESDLHRLVAGLPEPQREVVLLRFVGDLSLGEIAETVGVPVGTVKSRLHNALATIRRLRAPE